MAELQTLMRSPILRYGALIFAATILSAFFFPGGIRRVFSSTEFLPHATCYLQNANLIRLHVITDLVIGLAYVSISCTLGYLVWKASRDIPFHWMFLSFGIFIVSCGFTHFMEVWTVWESVYWLSGYVKAITAAASAVTAIALFPLVPKIFAMINAVKVSEQRRQLLEQTTARLEAANLQLAERQKELELANRDLEMFNYSVAHDLRAPLRSMQGFAELLQEKSGQNLGDEEKKYSGRIVAAAQSMARFLGDLRTYSTTGRKEIQLQPLKLRPFVQEILENFQADISRKNARVDVHIQDQSALADPTLATQVIANLLSNALKYVPPATPPHVRITAEDRANSIRIEIWDNGVGIDPKYHERIFRIFERLDHDNSGSGLGLPIVKRAAERMNGRIGLESIPGNGSTFWVELPRA